SVSELALRGIANFGRDATALVHGGVQLRFVEVGRLEALEEDDVWMLAANGPRTAGIADRRHALRTVHAVIAQVRTEVREVGFERVEERKRFGGIDVVEVAAKAQGVLAEGHGEIVHQLKPRFAVEVGVAAVHAGREGVGEFEVRLRRYRREVERAARK